MSEVLQTRGKRDLALLAVGAGVSNMGSMLTLVGLTVRLHESGPHAVAALFVTATLGGILGAPIAGWLVDRYRNRPLYVTVLLIQAVTLLGLLSGLSVLPVVFAALGIMGMSGAVTGTCTSVLVARITAEDHGVRGFAWLSTARTVGAMSGTVLGGVVTAGPGLEVALLIDAATSVIQAVLISRIRADRDPRVTDRPAGASRRSLAGLAQLRQDRVLLVRLAAHTVAMMAMTLALANEIFLVTQVLGGDEVAYSIILTCWGVGVLFGGMVSRRLKGTAALLRAYTFGTGLMAMAFVLSAVFPHVAVNAGAWIIAGGCSAVQNITLNALVQARTPDEAKGRVYAAAGTTLIIANTAGYLCAGVVIATVGPQWTLVGAAALICPATAAMVVITARRHDESAAPAEPTPNQDTSCESPDSASSAASGRPRPPTSTSV
jgi:predicted MFS family arabinose efflux permease